MPWTSLVGYIYLGKVDRYRVITRTVSDGRGGTSTLTFSYSGLGLSSDGTEFRGHASIRAVDPLGHYTDTWFKQDDLLKGRPYHSQTRRSSSALLMETTNIWATSTPYPGVTFAKLTQIDTMGCDDNGAGCRTASQSFEHDAYGNQTRAYQWGDVALTGDERDEYIDWVVDATNWIHRPKRAALYSNTGGTLLRERWFSYDGLGWGALGVRGLLTREERRLVGGVGTSGNPVATAGYDAYGNRTSITDPRGCAATIVFESIGQAYPTTVTTCLGHVMSFAYDARWGLKTSESDPNNQTTTYTYDTFGRLTKATGPLDTGSLYGSISRVYDNFGNPSTQRIVTYRTTAHGTSSAIWNDEYFDGLGRAYLRRSQGPGSQIIQSEATFDSRGLKTTESAPHFSTESAVQTQFTYDARGRQTQVTYPDGNTFKTAYAPDRITLTDQRNNVIRRFLDIYGRVTKVEEVNGAETYATTYAYNAAGGLTGITNHLGHSTTLTYDLLGRRTAISDPNTGTTTTTYEPGGAVLSQTNARNQTVTFTYDQQGRVLTKTLPGAQVTWTHDDPTVAYSKGRVTKVTDATSVTSFAYNQIGRTTQVQRLLDGTTYTMSRSYNALGQVLSQTFPDGDGVTYTYNEAGWLASIPSFISGITYDARGQRTQIQYANGVTTTQVYHLTNFRLTSRSTTGSGGSQQNLTYSYDPVGNVTQILDGLWTGGRTFTYDALNRLTSASGPFGPGQSSVTQNYSYNAIGNIAGKAGVTYTYTDALHPSAVTSRSDGPSYTYDASGNALTSAGRTLTWDAENRLLSVTQGGTTTFAYDPDGIRLRKTASGSVSRYPFPGYEIDPNGVITKYVGGIAKKSTGAMLFYHHDHLGGLNAVTNASGARVQLDEYEPWGQVSRAEGNVDPSHRFTGKELDPETGLYYYGGRYYDAALGRFVSADPVVPAAGNPQALNRYSYVINNPANLIDPSGHFFSKILNAIQKWAKGNKGLSIALGITLVGLPGPELNAVGIAMLTATPEGKLALAAGIIAGTAVATWYCGGCGGIATAALVGELIGLYSAVSSGGDVLTGVVVGGAVGALSGYVGGYLGGLVIEPCCAAVIEPASNMWLRVGSWAVQGAGQGIASGYAGGRGTLQSIALSAALGAATSVVLNSAFYGLAHYEPTWQPGGDPQTTGPKDFPDPKMNNIFGTPKDPANPGFLDAGGPVSRALNLLYGANAGAGAHDGFMTYLIRAGLPTSGAAFWAVELPTIAPVVLGVGYGALLPGMTLQPMMDRMGQ
jgi:RHS repeat-associated protein